MSDPHQLLVSPLGLVAVDLDGTLVDSGGQVSQHTVETIRRVRETGIPVIVATGRGWLVTERTVAALGGADHAICSNGAMTLRLDDGHVLRDEFLPTGYAETIVERLRVALPGAGFALEFAVGVKAEDGFGRRLPAGVALGRPIDDVLALLPERGPVRKVLVFHDDYDDRITELAEMIDAAIDEATGPFADLHVQHSGLTFLEVGPYGSDKAVALAEVCELLGVEREAVVAFGDDVNDIPMLAWAGTGVAMANAVERVRATADVVTASNDDDGVAQYLDVLLARLERS